MSTPTTGPLLEVVGLVRSFAVRRTVLRAVDDVSLRIHRGETLGLVGESGCGKSTLGRCMLRLQTATDGTVRFAGTDISAASSRALRRLRPRMQMVFQDSTASLNPRRRVGDLVAEPLRIHPAADGRRRSRAEADARVHELFDLVGLRPDLAARYAHELSGGQRQRIGIARALALHPDLVVADEPVSALDVSVQAQVVNLMMDLQDGLGLTYVFIAHDLAVIRQVSTRVAVMYLGTLVEQGPVADVFSSPAHPYTAALLASVPRLSAQHRAAPALRGELPSPLDPPSGCRFHPRCPRVQARCRTERPGAQPRPGRASGSLPLSAGLNGHRTAPRQSADPCGCPTTDAETVIFLTCACNAGKLQRAAASWGTRPWCIGHVCMAGRRRLLLATVCPVLAQQTAPHRYRSRHRAGPGRHAGGRHQRETQRHRHPRAGQGRRAPRDQQDHRAAAKRDRKAAGYQHCAGVVAPAGHLAGDRFRRRPFHRHSRSGCRPQRHDIRRRAHPAQQSLVADRRAAAPWPTTCCRPAWSAASR